MPTRRRFLQNAGLLTAASVALPPGQAWASSRAGELNRTAAALEKRLGGARLGVSVIDTGRGRSWSHRGGERFPMCSTFKLLACAAVLRRCDQAKDDLARRIRFHHAELMAYSPITEKHTGGEGMTLGALCAAAMTESDNTAANLILKSLGGPPAVTAFARSIGDRVTRLDRWEPDLNTAIPGDPRDTTTPDAMAGDLRRLALGSALSMTSREQLAAWLRACKTGGARLRAGVPSSWREGDKTGTGAHGTANDVAIFWPPSVGSGASQWRQPLIAVVYLTETAASVPERNAAIAAIGRALAGLG